MADKNLAVTEECVEPELLSNGPFDGFHAKREEARTGFPPPQQPGLLTRLKLLLAGGLAILAFGLILIGAFLTSTIIGAILGIPLIILGGLVFFLMFKLLSLGSNSHVIFRRF